MSPRREGKDRCHGSKNDDGLIARTIRFSDCLSLEDGAVQFAGRQSCERTSRRRRVVALSAAAASLSLSGHWCGDRGPEMAVSAGVSTLTVRSCRAPEHVGRHRRAVVVHLVVVVGVFVVFPPHFRLSTLSPLVYSPRLVRFPRFFRQSVAAGKAARPVAAAAARE